ncbi:MAG: hypothetical protein R3F59_21210 [Myxococcota bacterium]
MRLRHRGVVLLAGLTGVFVALAACGPTNAECIDVGASTTHTVTLDCTQSTEPCHFDIYATGGAFGVNNYVDVSPSSRDLRAGEYVTETVTITGRNPVSQLWLEVRAEPCDQPVDCVFAIAPYQVASMCGGAP